MERFRVGNRIMTTHRRDSGFSLIEMLVALLLLGFGMLAVAPLFVYATRVTAALRMTAMGIERRSADERLPRRSISAICLRAVNSFVPLPACKDRLVSRGPTRSSITCAANAIWPTTRSRRTSGTFGVSDNGLANGRLWD